MKKSIVILLVIISIFVVSCAPQVTVTSEVTVTLSTVTQTPEPSATPTAVYTPTLAKDIITNSSGIGFELGAQIEGQPEGVRAVVDIVPSESMNAEKQAEFEIRTNPMTYGFKEGETYLVYIPAPNDPYKKFRVELQRTSNADVIATFGNTDFVWNLEQLVDENGEPIALRVGKIITMEANRVSSDDINAVTTDVTDMGNEFRALTHTLAIGGFAAIFTSKDGKQGVPFIFHQTKENDESKGTVTFRAVDGRSIIKMYVVGYNGDLSFAVPITR